MRLHPDPGGGSMNEITKEIEKEIFFENEFNHINKKIAQDFARMWFSAPIFYILTGLAILFILYNAYDLIMHFVSGRNVYYYLPFFETAAWIFISWIPLILSRIIIHFRKNLLIKRLLKEAKIISAAISENGTKYKTVFMMTIFHWDAVYSVMIKFLQ